MAQGSCAKLNLSNQDESLDFYCQSRKTALVGSGCVARNHMRPLEATVEELQRKEVKSWGETLGLGHII